MSTVKPALPSKLPAADVQWEPLIPALGRANRALARYDGILFSVPDPAILLSPMTTQEAVLSSRIEGTQATLNEVLRFEAGDEPEQESRRFDIQEIINYRAALRRAQESLRSRPFNLNLLLDLHAQLLDSVRGRNKGRGHFRRVQNWIGSAGCTIEQADFVPPDPMALMEYLDNWEKYYHSDRPDPLVQLAIVHAQFEIIHPFLDGNGRIGRILIPMFLFEKHLLSQPMFYLSGYFDEHRDEYVARLRALGGSTESWNAWIEFFLAAVEAQALRNADKARDIKALYDRLKSQVIELTRSQFAVPLLDALFETPVFPSTQVRLPGRKQPSRQAVAQLLRVLREEKILKVVREGSGRRAQVLALAELINLAEGRTVI